MGASERFSACRCDAGCTMTDNDTAAAPESLLASADMPPQGQINDEIATLHADAAARVAAGDTLPQTLYDFAPYRSSILRHHQEPAPGRPGTHRAGLAGVRPAGRRRDRNR